MFGGIAFVGLGLILMSYTTSIGIFYCAFVLIAIGMSGVSPTVMSTSVANWFRKKIGLATGIAFCGFSFGGLLVPLVVKLIDIYDWRPAAIIITVIIWVIGFPLALVIRHKPEQYGLSPDGEKSAAESVSEMSSEAVNDEVEISAKQAVKGRIFWHISVTVSLSFIGTAAFIIHVMPYLSNIGVDRSTAALVAMVASLITIVGRLASGWLGDKFNKIKVAIIFLVLSGLGPLIFSYVRAADTLLIFLSGILIGIGWGAISTIRTAIIRECFGRKSFGTIFGFSMGLTAVGVVLGPLLAGWIFDTYGSYRPAWLLFSCLVFIAVIVIATMPRKMRTT